MATQLFLRDVPNPVASTADTHRGTNTAKRNGTASGWIPLALSTTRGAGLTGSSSTLTVAGPTDGIEVINTTSGLPIEWISPPVSADVTISGTITANIWADEFAMADNVAINVIIDIIRSSTSGADASNTIQNIVQSSRVTELGTGTPVAVNFTTGMTSGAYTGQTLNRGDRLRIRVVGDDAGTMGAGGSFEVTWNHSAAAANGDTYVTFTENFSFESAPAGSVLYLTDTASDVVTADTDLEMWTARGAGVSSASRSTVTGWTAPLSFPATTTSWFTKQLQAFTLTGMAVVNIRASETNASANASLRCEIARVDADGTNAVVWASWCIAPIGTDSGELTTTEAARTCYLSGDDLAISDGQRLRFRVYAEDTSAVAMATAFSLTVYWDGTTAAASGDTYITLPQTVAEFVAATAGSVFQTRRQRRASRFLSFR